MLIMQVKKAKEEAKRFLEKVAILERETRTPPGIQGPLRRTPEGPKSAAVKRASLDLTMALASMRKSD